MSQARPVDGAGVPTDFALVFTGQDGSIRLWPDDLPWEPEALRGWRMSLTSDEPSASSWR